MHTCEKMDTFDLSTKKGCIDFTQDFMINNIELAGQISMGLTSAYGEKNNLEKFKDIQGCLVFLKDFSEAELPEKLQKVYDTNFHMVERDDNSDILKERIKSEKERINELGSSGQYQEELIKYINELDSLLDKFTGKALYKMMSACFEESDAVELYTEYNTSFDESTDQIHFHKEGEETYITVEKQEVLSDEFRKKLKAYYKQEIQSLQQVVENLHLIHREKTAEDVKKTIS